jgi:hypothetical protein
MDEDDDNQKIPKKIRLDEVHWKIVRGLTPFYGSTEAEVVRTIVMIWIHDNIGSDAIRKLEELNAIHLNERKY